MTSWAGIQMESWLTLTLLPYTEEFLKACSFFPSLLISLSPAQPPLSHKVITDLFKGQAVGQFCLGHKQINSKYESQGPSEAPTASKAFKIQTFYPILFLVGRGEDNNTCALLDCFTLGTNPTDIHTEH